MSIFETLYSDFIDYKRIPTIRLYENVTNLIMVLKCKRVLLFIKLKLIKKGKFLFLNYIHGFSLL